MKSYTVKRIDLTGDEIEMLRQVRDWAYQVGESEDFDQMEPSVQDAIMNISDGVEILFDRVEWDTDLSEI